ncbi:MAG: inorganic phosphate transporter, partial [Ilumatobacteraceae bacterium]
SLRLASGQVRRLRSPASSKGVAETMSHRVTSMSPGHGLVANVSAAFLVITASRYALPVSTTHVTGGGLFAIGAETGQARWPVITAILAAWVTTLPLAAVLGALTYLAFGL